MADAISVEGRWSRYLLAGFPHTAPSSLNPGRNGDTICFVDCEATGTSPARDRLIEVVAVAALSGAVA